MKIVLVGYGHMGRAIEEIAKIRGHEIVLTIDKGQDERFFDEAFRSADVAIEFTTPMTAEENCIRCLTAGVPTVCGTTGFINEESRARLEEIVRIKDGTFFWASNFSLGMNVFFELNRKLAKLMSPFPDYQAEINEIHHIHKKDAPSGTAITLAEGIIQENENYDRWRLEESHEEARDRAGVLPVFSLREGEIPGVHEISYCSQQDIISIQHEAFGREGFAYGAILAAEYASKNKGWLSMRQLLSLD